MSFEPIHNVYFIGIGGIGMSALARYFKAEGKFVAGYDRTPTPLTDDLIDEGIDIHFTDDVSLIPSALRITDLVKHNTLVVYTPAVPGNHAELNYFNENGFRLMKRSAVLGLITEQGYTIAVAGTHGKTTTSSMIAHLLKSSGIECTAFLGGISKNFHSNLLLSKEGSRKIFVVEADEYDRSFLTLHPDIAVITSVDADHLDIYGGKKAMEDSYRQFAMQVKPGGRLIHKKGLPFSDLPVERSEYSVDGQGDYTATGIQITNHRYHFNWKNSSTAIDDITSQLPGRHNVENAVAAIAAVRQLGLGGEQIAAAMKSYTGVIRRFDYQYQSEKTIYIDDYAHHPEELRACIASARELYPGKKITGIFQPHLFSRTKDFAEEFAKSLSMLDVLFLLDIYPARELPMEGVTSKIIFDKVTVKDKTMCSEDELISLLDKQPIEVLLTLGAGDIDQLVHPIRNFLIKKAQHE